uniref:HDC14021 n=1 Tax=Drosophila melanogaster TaxID=7227 RepID=Q6IJX3_DROME|nr:TPA_inf: HDC14021 [Drosophila melanogaster]
MRNAHTLPTHTYSFPLGTASRPQKCSLIASTKRRHLFLVAAGERGQKSRKLGQGNCVDDVGFLNKCPENAQQNAVGGIENVGNSDSRRRGSGFNGAP